VRRVVVPSTLPPALDRLFEAAVNDLRDHTMALFQPDFREPNVTSVVLSLRRARQWRMAELVLGLREPLLRARPLASSRGCFIITVNASLCEVQVVNRRPFGISVTTFFKRGDVTSPYMLYRSAEIYDVFVGTYAHQPSVTVCRAVC